ncbi:MAG: DegT/DnrJ/EryC1/StrS aminotransferase family protein [Xanthomonadales bacterium]|nr:DegT/DnrJ/EryC1/StrS aminotransferase family protein [Xanthomonadales bacterium]
MRDVLLSNKVNYWTGTECRAFEKEYAAWAGTRYAVALANGTLALDVALHALGIGPGDEVVVTPRTFIASVSCVVNAGATPVFADVDPDSGNLSAETIARVLTPRTRAVICVHLAGWPCDMDPIMALAEQHGLKVIEDCAQAHGARYKGRSVGSIGHVGAWSFCQDKIMTTGGEGGMVTTNDEALWRDMWSFKDHGKSYAAVYEREHPPGFRWLHEGFGTNWRMLEMQAAVGRIQLRRMAAWTAAREAHAEAILAVCRRHAVLRVPEFRCNAAKCDPGCAARSGCVHAQYKCYAYVNPERLAEGWSRDRIAAEINARGVPCYQGSCSEVYLERAFDDTGWRPAERLPVARALGETSLMWLVHPTLTAAEIDQTCKVVDEVLGLAAR